MMGFSCAGVVGLAVGFADNTPQVFAARCLADQLLLRLLNGLVEAVQAGGTLRDPRVGLMLSGHMHGGQIVIPGLGYHRLPSRYGLKYLQGLIKAPRTRVFVSRGLGTVGLPLRIRCRPEINLLTLAAA
jgi:hypothetical protein